MDRSLPATLSRLVALDGIPFSKFCTSEDLRRLLSLNNPEKIPKSPNTIKKIVLEYGQQIFTGVVEEISQRKIRGDSFSISCDEWTSVRNRRYLNVNLHASDTFWNLGLVRIHGSLPAEKCVELLKQKLIEFSLSFNNIISIITDGAAIMKKTCELAKINNQVCMAHAIQLAVIKVLYKKCNVEAREDDCHIVHIADCQDSDSDLEESDNEEGDDGLQISYDFTSSADPQEILFQSGELNVLIMKIRKVIRLFRKSPTKNDDILQRHVKEEKGKELSLTLDSKTRWNSLLAMLERFFDLKNSVRKSLIDLKSDISFTEDEMELLSNTISALQPIKIAVEALCRADIDLYVADAALEFMLQELATQSFFLSNNLKEELIERIKERRTIYSDILQYLYAPEKLNEKDNYGIFNNVSRNNLMKAIVELVNSIIENNGDEGIEGVIADEDDNDLQSTAATTSSTPITTEENISGKNTPSIPLSIEDKFDQFMKSKTATTAKIDPVKKNSVKNIVKKEMNYFEDQKIQGKLLQMVFKALKSIKPTSVESERAFSNAGLICTKLRSRLGDESLNTLSFLRSHFLILKNKKK